MDVILSRGSHALCGIVIYRPPEHSDFDFINDFTDLVDYLNLYGGKLLILGDFNIHVDVCDNRYASSFLDMLDASNLIQHVIKPTHIWYSYFRPCHYKTHWAPSK